MNRFTYRGDNGEAYINYMITDYAHAVMRLAELEDNLEFAEKIQNDLQTKKGGEMNMLDLQPGETREIDVSLLLKNGIKSQFATLRTRLHDMSDGKPEFDIAIQRLDESEFWALKALSGE